MFPHPILFLDIDGVLNTPGAHTRSGGRECFTVTAVAALRDLLESTDARIVISSSWREDAAKRIPVAFHANGLSAYVNRIVGFTPVISEAAEQTRRADEIDAWLANQANPELRYAVLDDDPAAALAGNFVFVDPDIGLTALNAEHAKGLLGEAAGSADSIEG